jgi:hypothetical protein
MQKIVQHGLVWTATLFLLLHSFFPHNHQAEIRENMSIERTGCEHDANHSLVEIAHHIFAQDIGVEHLEHILRGEFSTFQVSPNLATVNFYFNKNIENDYQEHLFSTIQEKPTSKGFHTLHALRGPPLV